MAAVIINAGAAIHTSAGQKEVDFINVNMGEFALLAVFDDAF
jgi:hypothetical protein